MNDASPDVSHDVLPFQKNNRKQASPSLFRSPMLGCLGILTFEQGVAWLTGSYSMAVRPIEKHPCALRGKGTQIKYASRWLRALFHAKPNISQISAKDKVKVRCHM